MRKALTKIINLIMGVETKTTSNIYRGYKIVPNPYQWMNDPWMFSHEDYDGPGDNRFGTGADIEDCKREIDAIEEMDE